MDTSHDKPGLASRVDAWLYDAFLSLGERRGMAARRRALLASAGGRVLELGAGTGLNLENYPASVTELVLSEPEAGMHARLRRRLVRGDGAATTVLAPAEALPFPDDRFDTVVSTLVLCTVADVDATLAEVRRVLAPSGRRGAGCRASFIRWSSAYASNCPRSHGCSRPSAGSPCAPPLARPVESGA